MVFVEYCQASQDLLQTIDIIRAGKSSTGERIDTVKVLFIMAQISQNIPLNTGWAK